MADETNTDSPTLEEVAEGEKLDQKVTVEDAGPARKKITIEIPESRIQEKIAGNFEELQGAAVLPGFRRGRAPKRLLEKRFGSDVRQEVKQQLIGESYQQAIEEKDLRVLGDPDTKHLEELELPESGPLTFDVEVEVAPEFELPDLKDITVEKEKIEVTDDQVEAEIERFCEMQGKTQSVEGPTEEGDYLTADITIKNAEGEVVESQENGHVYVPGESRKYKGVVAGILVEDLGKQIAEQNIGDQITVEATGPTQHEKEELREAKLTIDIKIKQIERLVPAEVSALLEQFGFETEDELHERIKENLEQRAQQQQQQHMREQVEEALLEKIDIELPGGLTQDQTERILSRKQMEMLYQGASEQDIEEGLAELRASSEEQAKRELKLFFILDKVAADRDVEVSEGELNGTIAQLAMQRGERPEKMRQEMARSGRLQSIYIQLRENKAVDAILEDVEVKEVEPKTE